MASEAASPDVEATAGAASSPDGGAGSSPPASPLAEAKNEPAAALDNSIKESDDDSMELVVGKDAEDTFDA